MRRVAEFRVGVMLVAVGYPSFDRDERGTSRDRTVCREVRVTRLPATARVGRHRDRCVDAPLGGAGSRRWAHQVDPTPPSRYRRRVAGQRPASGPVVRTVVFLRVAWYRRLARGSADRDAGISYGRTAMAIRLQRLRDRGRTAGLAICVAVAYGPWRSDPRQPTTTRREGNRQCGRG